MKEPGTVALAAWLDSLGVDCSEETMQETPKRMHELYASLLDGVGKDTASIWGDILETEQTGLVAITNIPFVSLCEHHMVPFTGQVDIVYHPTDGRVVGLGKFQRLVACLAHRPQLQERLTREIAEAIERDLGAQGVLVRVQARHMCMILRSDSAKDSVVGTTEGRGTLGADGTHREEGFLLLRGVKA